MSYNELKCVTLNVRGLNDRVKRSKVFQWLMDIKSDIVFVQETFCTDKGLYCFNSAWKGTVEHAVTDSAHSRGVSILFNDKINVTIENKHASNDGRILLLNVDINGKSMTLINTYACNTEKQRITLFRKLKKWINLYAKHKENTVIAGDMNCCLRKQDRSTNTHLNDKSRIEMENILCEFKLKVHGHLYQMTQGIHS